MGDRKVKKKKRNLLWTAVGEVKKGRVDGEEDGGCHFFSSTV